MNEKTKTFMRAITFILCAISFALIISVIFSSEAKASCLTAEQLSAISNITSHLNMTNSSIIDIFSMICYNISSLTNSTSDIRAVNDLQSSNFSNFYNRTEDDSRINAIDSKLASNMSAMYSSININAISVANTTANDAISGIETRMNSRLNNLRGSLPDNSTLNARMDNLTSLMYQNNQWIRNDINASFNSFNHVWMWLFLALAGAVFGGAYLWRYHPEKISFISGVKARKISNVDMISPGDFTTQLKRLREVKMSLTKRDDITFEERQVLFNKVHKSEITDEDSLEQEIEIIKAQREPKKEALKKKKVKKQ